MPKKLWGRDKHINLKDIQKADKLFDLLEWFPPVFFYTLLAFLLGGISAILIFKLMK
jgi:hypothetical protein